MKTDNRPPWWLGAVLLLILAASGVLIMSGLRELDKLCSRPTRDWSEIRGFTNYTLTIRGRDEEEIIFLVEIDLENDEVFINGESKEFRPGEMIGLQHRLTKDEIPALKRGCDSNIFISPMFNLGMPESEPPKEA